MPTPPVSQPAPTGGGSIPRVGALASPDPLTHRSPAPGWPVGGDTREDPLDERSDVRGDDVHDRLVRVLHAPEEADAARGHRLRRGQHRGRRERCRAGHAGERRQPHGPDARVRRRERDDEPEHRPGEGPAGAAARRVIPAPRSAAGDDRPLGNRGGSPSDLSMAPREGVMSPTVEQSAGAVPAALPSDVVCPPTGHPAVLVVRTVTGWWVLGADPVHGWVEATGPAAAEAETLSLVEAMSLADL